MHAMGMRIALAFTACVLAVARTHRSCAPLLSFGLCGDGWLDRCGTVLHCYLFKVGVGPLDQYTSDMIYSAHSEPTIKKPGFLGSP